MKDLVMDLSCRSNRYGRQLIYNYCYININKNINTTIQFKYEGWNFNSGNYLFTTDTK